VNRLRRATPGEPSPKAVRRPRSSVTTLVAFAGLPGTGKSTLARRVASELGAPLFDKDRVRDALFGPDHVAYTREQDDFVVEVLFQAIEHLLAHAPPHGQHHARNHQARRPHQSVKHHEPEPREP